jgi:hypothetical protein
MKNKLLIILIFLSVAIVSCTDDAVKPAVLPASTKTILLSADIQPVFTTNCVGCHSTGGIAPDLDTTLSYNALTTGNYISTSSPSSSILYQEIISGGGMNKHVTSPTPPIQASTFISNVLTWIQQGAKNN